MEHFPFVFGFYSFIAYILAVTYVIVHHFNDKTADYRVEGMSVLTEKLRDGFEKLSQDFYILSQEKERELSSQCTNSDWE